jgi:hypothetical protein
MMFKAKSVAEMSLGNILPAIKLAAPSLHKAGTFPGKTFDALIDHLSRHKIVNSLETGSGASTLLFSHLSEHHTVFALDGGNQSINSVRNNPLLQPETVVFVEGPTQQTLPVHQFDGLLQAALIDGPHGYPFPDLEYYFIYPHLDVGALLIIDDINIRSVHNLFSVVRADKMFQLEQIVKTTAFFRRTDAPIFDPLGDGWWQQGYNQRPPWRFMARYLAKRIVPSAVIRAFRK